jgi:hypothetical protein
LLGRLLMASSALPCASRSPTLRWAGSSLGWLGLLLLSTWHHLVALGWAARQAGPAAAWGPVPLARSAGRIHRSKGSIAPSPCMPRSPWVLGRIDRLPDHCSVPASWGQIFSRDAHRNLSEDKVDRYLCQEIEAHGTRGQMTQSTEDTGFIK